MLPERAICDPSPNLSYGCINLYYYKYYYHINHHMNLMVTFGAQTKLVYMADVFGLGFKILKGQFGIF